MNFEFNDFDSNNRATDMKFGLALQKGDVETVKDLFESKSCFPNQHDSLGMSPLYIAAQHGHADLVRFLLAAGANVKFKSDIGVTPLHMSIWYQKCEAAQKNLALMRAMGLNVEDLQLYSPTKKNCREVAKLLLDAGADINSVDCRGRTPLDLAESLGNHTKMIALLKNWPSTVSL